MNWPIKLEFLLNEQPKLNYEINDGSNGYLNTIIDGRVFEIKKSNHKALFNAINDILIDVSEKTELGICIKNIDAIGNHIYMKVTRGSINKCVLDVGKGLIDSYNLESIKYSYKR